jgi:hypothetical protein
VAASRGSDVVDGGQPLAARGRRRGEVEYWPGILLRIQGIARFHRAFIARTLTFRVVANVWITL